VSNKFRAGICVLMVMFASGPSYAGPFADEMAKCLVRATTQEDKTALVQWIFAFMTLHPDVKQYSAVTPAQRDKLNRQVSDLMVALLTDRCVNESREALKNEGMVTIQTSFSVLGQSAVQTLFSNPEVASGLEQFGKMVDGEKLKKLIESAK